MEWYEQEVRQLESARSLVQLPADPVAFYGSSSISQWDTLASDLHTGRAVNVGFGGSTLEACVYFFERLVLPLRPCSLVVYAGDNDLSDGRKPQHVYASFKSLAAKIDRNFPQLAFTFLSIKPSPARLSLLDRIRQANALIRGEMEARRCGLFLDVFHAMLDSRCKPRPELFTTDGLHMNRDGYRLWGQLFLPYRHRIFVENCYPLKSGQLSSS